MGLDQHARQLARLERANREQVRPGHARRKPGRSAGLGESWRLSRSGRHHPDPLGGQVPPIKSGVPHRARQADHPGRAPGELLRPREAVPEPLVAPEVRPMLERQVEQREHERYAAGERQRRGRRRPGHVAAAGQAVEARSPGQRRGAEQQTAGNAAPHRPHVRRPERLRVPGAGHHHEVLVVRFRLAERLEQAAHVPRHAAPMRRPGTERTTVDGDPHDAARWLIPRPRGRGGARDRAGRGKQGEADTRRYRRAR